jgi:hypothetical protein
MEEYFARVTVTLQIHHFHYVDDGMPAGSASSKVDCCRVEGKSKALP